MLNYDLKDFGYFELKQLSEITRLLAEDYLSDAASAAFTQAKAFCFHVDTRDVYLEDTAGHFFKVDFGKEELDLV